jgi:hypothetical protein
MSDAMKRALKRHVREKAIVQEAAKDVRPQPDADGTVHSAKTDTGLPVQDQVRKEWNSKKGGLPILCR